MLFAAFSFEMILTSIVLASTSAKFLHCISCPCGSGSQNYIHCTDESLLKDFTCERWSHCQTCKANTAFCITCPPGRFGPTCSENEHIRRKRQDDPDILNRPWQPDSGTRSLTRCENHGHISNGRMFVFPPSGNYVDEDDFDFPYGTQLKYTCYEGYVLVGEDTLRCASDGFWTESVPECKQEKPASQGTCTHPGVDVNGRIRNNPLTDSRGRRQVFPVGTKLTFSCNDGFEPDGTTDISCLGNGKWTSNPPSCRRSLAPTDTIVRRAPKRKATCRDPGTPENGGRRDVKGDQIPSNHVFNEGDVIIFFCNERNPTSPGNTFLTCKPDARWDGIPPRCPASQKDRPKSQSTCTHPGVNMNSRIKDNPLLDPRRRRRVFPEGAKLSFICNEGFEPEGPTVISCLSNGDWTSLPPSCRSKP